MSKDSFVVTTEEGSATGIWWGEARNAANHPSTHRTPRAKNCMAHSVIVAGRKTLVYIYTAPDEAGF